MTQRPSSLPDANSAVAQLTPTPQVSLPAGPHELECFIQRSLLAHPRLQFARLTVHKCPQGVCLEGLLEVNDDVLDLCDLVKEIAGVQTINHVVMGAAKPR